MCISLNSIFYYLNNKVTIRFADKKSNLFIVKSLDPKVTIGFILPLTRGEVIM